MMGGGEGMPGKRTEINRNEPKLTEINRNGCILIVKQLYLGTAYCGYATLSIVTNGRVGRAKIALLSMATAGLLECGGNPLPAVTSLKKGFRRSSLRHPFFLPSASQFAFFENAPRSLNPRN